MNTFNLQNKFNICHLDAIFIIWKLLTEYYVLSVEQIQQIVFRKMS